MPDIIVALITSVIGGSLVAFVNHLLTRRKYEAETKKLEAEIEKLKAETKKTLAESEKISSDTSNALGEARYYDSKQIDEVILYDGRQGIQGHDIHTEWAELTIQNGAVLIQDQDSAFILRKYIYDGKECEFIPKNELASGERKFRVSCELKVIRASYDVDIDIEHQFLEEDLGVRKVEVTSREWKKFDLYFRIRSDADCFVFVYALRTSGEGSLQIRNIVVAERVS